MKENVFVDLVLDHFLFFATCTDSQCDQDVAVKMMDSIGGALKSSGTAEDRRRLMDAAAQRAQHEPNAEVRATLRSVGDILGIES